MKLAVCLVCLFAAIIMIKAQNEDGLVKVSELKQI